MDNNSTPKNQVKRQSVFKDFGDWIGGNNKKKAATE